MVIKLDMLYTPTGENRPLHIHLPEGYETSQERYPVMYFFDGHNLFFDQDATYGKSWGLEAFLSRWEKPMIIVGMECGHKGSQRLGEYSPYSFSNSYMGKVTGIGDQTMKWIVDEIKPMIDRQFRTYSFREATAIGGSSMGGLMAYYAVTRYNSVFSKAACLSSALMLCKEPLFRRLPHWPIDPDTRVWLSWGSQESGSPSPEQDYATHFARVNIAAAEHIRTQGGDARLLCQRPGGHCEADWEKQVPGFMEYLWF